MINISKFLAVGSLLLYGINAGSSDWDEYELGLELDDFYGLQSDVALCGYDFCPDKDEYLRYFVDDCNVCIPREHEEFAVNKMTCYESKEEYEMVLNEIYKEIKEILKWEHKIRDIQPSQTGGNQYGVYGYDQKVYTVEVKVDKEYIKGQCVYRTCETEEFVITNGKITSYHVKKVYIKDFDCPEYGKTTKPPTSWEKSTTPFPSAPFPRPPSGSPSWSPTTPSPTTPYPTTPYPTTPYPTTPSPTTPKPTTPYPTTPSPTTPYPTTPKPTTPYPTTPSPTTPYPTTAKPTTAEPTTAEPTTAEPTAWPTPYPTTTAKPTTAEPTPWPTPYPTTTAKPTTAEPTPWPTPYPTTTAKPTTAEPTPWPTPYPTTPKPTTPYPTTPSPTTPSPTTPKPTTPYPTTPSPTTPSPTTPKPTTPYPTTAEPTPKPQEPIRPDTTMWESTANPTRPPKKCNYKGYGTECDYGYECVEDDCSEYDAYCSGICVKKAY